MPKAAKKAAAPPEHEIVTVPLADLHYDPNNARTHDERNLTAIAGSLREFGQTEPLVVQKSTMRVIGGNGRLEAMHGLGWDAAAVVLVDVDDRRATALGLALNRTAELAGWDLQRLQEMTELLSDTGFDVAAIGFDEPLDEMMDPPAIDGPDGPPAPEDVGPDMPKAGRPIQLTADQRAVFDKACTALREQAGEDYSEGRCLELMAADYIAGL